MKKIILIAASAAVLLTVNSCQKKDLDAQIVENAPEETVDVSFNLEDYDPVVSTKAMNASLESSIKSVQIFVFRKGGVQDGKVDNAVYVNLDNSASGTYHMAPIKCTVGAREAWAIVNAPVDYTRDVTTLDELKAKTVTLSQNADSDGQKLVMVGNVMTDAGGQVITNFTSGELVVKMKVSRLVAGVRLAKVVNKMQVPSLQGSLSITGAYLMNVPGKQRLDGTLLASKADDISDDEWYAKNKKASGGDPLALLVQSAGTPVAVPFGDTGIAPEYLFYSMPTDIGGPVDDKTMRVESYGDKFRTSTYLVVEAKIGDMACVYPILLPAMEANKKYSVSLTINHIGGDPAKPWEKIKFADIDAVVDVGAWTDVPYSEVI